MGNVEIPKWLKGLPLAPEFRPTDTEFADPVAYISKIEKEASAFGICKIIPPLPKPSKKYVFSNLNKSLTKCPDLGSDVDMSTACSSPKIDSADSGTDGEVRAVFTTRQQELGQSGKRVKGVADVPLLGVHKKVWQSGEIYTLEQFEAKSKAFAKGLLSTIKDVTPLVIEASFWKVASEKPIYVEYANDVPGSGFGEPEGQFRCFHKRRRRRKRMSYRRRESSDCEKNEVANPSNSHNDDIKDASIKSDAKTCLKVPGSSMSTSTTASEENSHSRRRHVHATNDIEGTAGWKLSNSPWNLQVIARSPGSLTCFMPDDIPGVTSPMVYIGMLFSWFAWHVEDHELHSMNFLHTGSSKTWYAVPGDYALAFEEAIHMKAYGGNMDRLAALSLLGEKTTLVSPELVVASGIPCCRLVQNPGEFVVTFPRAYHVGFSHGFNCGEAANFGTPQWLQVAKEAAVRRAAMNYLPMLSHQQLLYVLTMSFISRVPRSLLPGARSSRLRDRLKEDRELLVKKAFIEDMLHENNLFSILLGRGSTCQAVIWEPELLSYPSKDSEYPSGNTAVSTVKQETVTDIHSENKNQCNLLDEMSLYMERLNDLYLNDDDLSCDFQLDSGTLACVACGILGYPFMSVVQPSERASMELLSGDHISCQSPTVSEVKTSLSHQYIACTAEGSVSGSLPPEDVPLPSINGCKGWNTSNKYLRPRIFCLEHTVQIGELMQSKGGANMMVICHSDYQKIKAHAAVIAEEIGSTFNYNDVPLGTASEEDLNLINIAIDDEHAECGEDWTSKLGVNLQHCVKVIKNSPSKQIQHALPLGGLFSEKSCSSDLSNIKWMSRRSRSKAKLDQPFRPKQCNSVELKKDAVLAEKLDGNIIKKEQKIIQYSRRKKSKLNCFTGVIRGPGCPNKDLAIEQSAAKCGFSDMPGRIHEVTNQMSVTSASHLADSSATANLVAGSLEKIGNQISEALNIGGNACNLAACNNSEIQVKIKVTDRISGNNEHSFSDKFSASYASITEERLGENVRISREAGDGVSEELDEGLPSRSVLIHKDHYTVNSAGLLDSDSSAARANAKLEGEETCVNSGVHDIITSDTTLQQEIQATLQGNNGKNVSCDNKLIMDKPSSSSICESSEHLMNISATADFSIGLSLEDKTWEASKTTNESKVEPVLSCVTPTKCADSVLMEKILNVPKQPNAMADSSSGLSIENKVTPHEIQMEDASKPETHSSSVAKMAVDKPFIFSLKDRIGAEEDLHTDVTLDIEVQQEIQDAKGANVIASSNVQPKQKQPSPTLAEACSEAPMETCAREMLCANPTSDDDRCEKDLTAKEIDEEESVSCCFTPINEPTPNSIQKYTRIQKEKYATKNVHHGSEASSSPDRRENVNIEPAVEDGVSSASNERKRKREVEQKAEKKFGDNGFIRSPCEGLRSRARKDAAAVVDISSTMQMKFNKQEVREPSISIQKKQKNAKAVRKESHKCDIENCRLSFETKEELRLHKRNRCPQEGCGKKFRSHKYAVLHQRVHEDDRPLKCPWEGCSMSFKWAWARTEHIRVHTGEKPYHCKVEGCGLSFRFVSDFSRHRRKTGHYVDSSS
ncbi:hypothetical protein SLA2020_422470 [Shorea laevis]